MQYLAGANGTIAGDAIQYVPEEANSSSVTAVPNTNYYFSGWSDGTTDNPRTDSNVISNLSVTAIFQRVTEISMDLNNILEIYPNPFDEYIFIVSYEPGYYDVLITDTPGRIIHRYEMSSNGTICLNLSWLQKGTYLINISGNSTAFIRKIVKN